MGAGILLTKVATVQLDIAIVAYDRYHPQAPRTLDLVSDADAYLPTIRGRLDDIRAPVIG